MKQRDRRAAEVAGAMAAAVLSVALPQQGVLFTSLNALAYFSLPFWLLRLADRLTSVPPWVTRGALAMAVVFSVPISLRVRAPVRPNLLATEIALVLAFYLAVTFTRQRFRSGGVTGRRLTLAAIGLWFYVALVTHDIALLVWLRTGYAYSDINHLLYLLVFYLFLFAFDTPRSWKARWQRLEQARYLSGVAERDAEDRGARAADDLMHAAARTVGNTLVLVALRRAWDADALVGRASTDIALTGLPVALDPGLVAEVCETRHSRDEPVVTLGPDLTAKLNRYGARVLVAPVASAVHCWGVVIVVQRRGSIFPADDLALLEQFARYAATALDHAELIAERRERDRRTAEQRLREVETRMGLMLDSIKDYALVIVDEKGAIVSWQPGAEHVFGYPAAEVIDEPISVLLGLSGGDLSALFDEARRRGHADREGLCRCRDGSKFVGATTIRPLVDADLRGFVAVTRDVTAQRDLEDRLRQSQKMEAIGQLAGGIAHDFNNQLTAILGYAEWLVPAVQGDEARAELAEIQKAAERAAGLTRQLLAFSRRQLLQPVPIELNALMADLLPMCRRLIGEHIAIVHRSDVPALHVRGDRSQMEQVIVNLVVNARDAMPNGGHLMITTHRARIDEAQADRDLPAGDYVLLEVADDGVGMEPATLSRVFEPFFTTKEFGKGTGLGLATVYGIVQQMGGVVRVTSTMGQGATFRLYMPAVDARAPDEVVPAREAAGATGGTILLVEDDTAVRTFLGQSLERQGYRVLSAGGWDDALALIDSGTDPISLLITDVMIPGGTGLDLADVLAKRRPDVPVLYMSGFPDSVMAGRGPFPRATHYLQKPFSAGDLLLHVTEILSHG